MKNYVLTKISNKPATYRLQPPGQYIGSTEIIFALDRIWIGGDLCPMRNGCISDLGYGESWFSQPKDEHYLCSKFLTKVWEPEQCRVALEDEVNQLALDLDELDGDSETKSQLDAMKQLVEDMQWDNLCECDIYRRLSEINPHYTDDGLPGYGYPTRDSELLVKIQHTFARLKNEVPN